MNLRSKTRDKRFILFDLAPDQYSYLGLKYLIYLYLGSLLIAAVLSGPVFLAFLEGQNDLCQYVVNKGLDKVFDRIRLIFVVLALPIFLKKCGISSLKNLGYDCRNCRNIVPWALSGICFMCAIGGLEIFLKNGNFQTSQKYLIAALQGLPKFLICALFVGILEEILFRGVILRVFYTAFSANFAVILSSIFFAYLHIKIPRVVQISSDSIGIFSGFRYIIPMLFGFLYKFKIFEFLKITILGIILSRLTLKYFSLNRAIGFHAGIVFAMLILNVLF